VNSKTSKSLNLNCEDIKIHLSKTKMPSNPCEYLIDLNKAHSPQRTKQKLNLSLKPAGVLLPIIKRKENLYLLFTHRSKELTHHANQVSFPGGKMDFCDKDIRATALRETKEEVDISPDEISVVGYLDTILTTTGYAVTPIVGLVEPFIQTKVNNEVDYIFEVPISYFLDKRNDIFRKILWKQQNIHSIEFKWNKERIWGVTAIIIILLRDKLLKQ